MTRIFTETGMQGVKIWRNESNRFVVFETHYTADPTKDSKYIENMKSSMPIAQFRQEFELVWDTFDGKAVFEDWNKEVHGFTGGFKPIIGLPLLVGIDQGLWGAALVCQLQGDDLIVFKEYMSENMGAERFSEYVMNHLRVDFPAWSNFKKDFIVGMDPTGFNRRDTDERTYASIWAKPFKVMPGENGFEKRRQSVERWLIKMRKGRPCFHVNANQAPILYDGFNGGYRYSDHAFEGTSNKVRPVKDQYSAPHDALQYILTLLEKKLTYKGKRIPTPEYAWSKQ